MFQCSTKARFKRAQEHANQIRNKGVMIKTISRPYATLKQQF
jgi:hypothetical protein